MAVETKRQWSSLLTTSLWGIELGDEAESVVSAIGNEFTPTSVEWIRYRFGEVDLDSDGVKYEDYVIVFVMDDNNGLEFDLRIQQVPDWVPTPPEGWDAQPGEFAKSE